MERFHEEMSRIDDMLARGGMAAADWVRARSRRLEALGGRLRSDVVLGMQSVADDEAYVLAYLDLVDAARRSHDHAACHEAACFARSEAVAYTPFSPAKRRRLEALLFPGRSLEWLDDVQLLLVRRAFESPEWPQGPLSWEADADALPAARKWALPVEGRP